MFHNWEGGQAIGSVYSIYW